MTLTSKDHYQRMGAVFKAIQGISIEVGAFTEDQLGEIVKAIQLKPHGFVGDLKGYHSFIEQASKVINDFYVKITANHENYYKGDSDRSIETLRIFLELLKATEGLIIQPNELKSFLAGPDEMKYVEKINGDLIGAIRQVCNGVVGIIEGVNSMRTYYSQEEKKAEVLKKESEEKYAQSLALRDQLDIELKKSSPNEEVVKETIRRIEELGYREWADKTSKSVSDHMQKLKDTKEAMKELKEFTKLVKSSTEGSELMSQFQIKKERLVEIAGEEQVKDREEELKSYIAVKELNNMMKQFQEEWDVFKEKSEETVESPLPQLKKDLECFRSLFEGIKDKLEENRTLLSKGQQDGFERNLKLFSKKIEKSEQEFAKAEEREEEIKGVGSANKRKKEKNEKLKGQLSGFVEDYNENSSREFGQAKASELINTIIAISKEKTLESYYKANEKSISALLAKVIKEKEGQNRTVEPYGSSSVPSVSPTPVGATSLLEKAVELYPSR